MQKFSNHYLGLGEQVLLAAKIPLLITKNCLYFEKSLASNFSLFPRFAFVRGSVQLLF